MWSRWVVCNKRFHGIAKVWYCLLLLFFTLYVCIYVRVHVYSHQCLSWHRETIFQHYPTCRLTWSENMEQLTVVSELQLCQLYYPCVMIALSLSLSLTHSLTLSLSLSLSHSLSLSLSLTHSLTLSLSLSLTLSLTHSLSLSLSLSFPFFLPCS